ncbi:MAG: hypothetical protein K8R36_17585 [Planctomycetales bacterium]|nr:hypothetical protein [Planctomycetales bacterium]
MKYSLRNLMIVVTLVAVFLGWWTHRCICLNCAELHEQQSRHLAFQAFNAGERTGWPPSAEEERQEKALIESYSRESKAQKSLAAEFRKAVWRPWIRLTFESPLDSTP